MLLSILFHLPLHLGALQGVDHGVVGELGVEVVVEEVGVVAGPVASVPVQFYRAKATWD